MAQILQDLAGSADAGVVGVGAAGVLETPVEDEERGSCEEVEKVSTTTGGKGRGVW
jgi:hypothetical protein